LAGRLADPLRILAAPRRGGAGRHQSMRAAIEWTASGLPAADTEALRALAAGEPIDAAAAARLRARGLAEPANGGGVRLLRTIAAWARG
ncbi:MAG: hypothetical protein ACLGHP_11170, partial [Vicinamibacteria bacterium]